MLAVVIAALHFLPTAVDAQTPATVTRVIDGDTVEATLATGQAITVRLIGIDTPETKRPGVPVECGGPEASEAMRRLVEGRAVTLTPDPTQDRWIGTDGRCSTWTAKTGRTWGSR